MATTAVTTLADLVVPQAISDYIGYKMPDSFGVLNNLIGPGRPIQTRGFNLQTTGGQYFEAVRWDKIANPVSRVDLTSNAEANVLQLTASYEKGPVCSVKFGPFSYVPQRTWMARVGSGEIERELASQCVQAMQEHLQNYIVNAIKGASAAFIAGASGKGFPYDHAYSVWNSSSGVYLTPTALANARSEMGDRIDFISDVLMRSEVANDLLGAQISSTVTGIGDTAARTGIPALLGLRPIIYDNAAFKTAAVTSSSTLSKWYSYLLGPGVLEIELIGAPQFSGAIEVKNSEEQQRIVLRGDMDFVIRVPGFTYAGTANPSDATLATAGSWTLTAGDHREFKCVRVETNSSAT